MPHAFAEQILRLLYLNRIADVLVRSNTTTGECLRGGDYKFSRFPDGKPIQPSYGGDYGMYRSSDAAASWSRQRAGLAAADIQFLAVDPGNPNTVYASGSAGVYKSTNGGTGWSATGYSGSPWRLTIDPGNTNAIYAAWPCSYINKSTGGGSTWNTLSSS